MLDIIRMRHAFFVTLVLTKLLCSALIAAECFSATPVAYIDPFTPTSRCQKQLVCKDQKLCKSKGQNDTVEMDLVMSDEFGATDNAWATSANDHPLWSAVTVLPDTPFPSDTCAHTDAVIQHQGQLHLSVVPKSVTCKQQGDGSGSRRAGYGAHVETWNKFCQSKGYVEVDLEIEVSQDNVNMMVDILLVGNLARLHRPIPMLDYLWKSHQTCTGAGNCTNTTNTPSEAGDAPVAKSYSQKSTLKNEYMGYNRGAPVISILRGTVLEEEAKQDSDISADGVDLSDLTLAGRGLGRGYQGWGGMVYLDVSTVTELLPLVNVSSAGSVFPNTTGHKLGSKSLSDVARIAGNSSRSFNRGWEPSEFGVSGKLGPRNDTQLVRLQVAAHWEPRKFVRHYVNGDMVYEITQKQLNRLGIPDDIGKLMIPEEPMHLVLSTGMRTGAIPVQRRDNPPVAHINYVRSYVPKNDTDAVGCSPASRPSDVYIACTAREYVLLDGTEDNLVNKTTCDEYFEPTTGAQDKNSKPVQLSIVLGLISTAVFVLIFVSCVLVLFLDKRPRARADAAEADAAPLVVPLPPDHGHQGAHSLTRLFVNRSKPPEPDTAPSPSPTPRKNANLQRIADQLISNLYIVEVLGAGSFGRVYRAQWNGTDVAVKVIQHQGFYSRRIQDETALSMLLRHPNVVVTYTHATRRVNHGEAQNVPRGAAGAVDDELEKTKSKGNTQRRQFAQAKQSLREQHKVVDAAFQRFQSVKARLTGLKQDVEGARGEHWGESGGKGQANGGYGGGAQDSAEDVGKGDGGVQDEGGGWPTRVGSATYIQNTGYENDVEAVGSSGSDNYDNSPRSSVSWQSSGSYADNQPISKDNQQAIKQHSHDTQQCGSQTNQQGVDNDMNSALSGDHVHSGISKAGPVCEGIFDKRQHPTYTPHAHTTRPQSKSTATIQLTHTPHSTMHPQSASSSPGHPPFLTSNPVFDINTPVNEPTPSLKPTPSNHHQPSYSLSYATSQSLNKHPDFFPTSPSTLTPPVFTGGVPSRGVPPWFPHATGATMPPRTSSSSYTNLFKSDTLRNVRSEAGDASVTRRDLQQTQTSEQLAQYQHSAGVDLMPAFVVQEEGEANQQPRIYTSQQRMPVGLVQAQTVGAMGTGLQQTQAQIQQYADVVQRAGAQGTQQQFVDSLQGQSAHLSGGRGQMINTSISTQAETRHFGQPLASASASQATNVSLRDNVIATLAHSSRAGLGGSPEDSVVNFEQVQVEDVGNPADSVDLHRVDEFRELDVGAGVRSESLRGIDSVRGLSVQTESVRGTDSLRGLSHRGDSVRSVSLAHGNSLRSVAHNARGLSAKPLTDSSDTGVPRMDHQFDVWVDPRTGQAFRLAAPNARATGAQNPTTEVYYGQTARLSRGLDNGSVFEGSHAALSQHSNMGPARPDLFALVAEDDAVTGPEYAASACESCRCPGCDTMASVESVGSRDVQVHGGEPALSRGTKRRKVPGLVFVSETATGPDKQATNTKYIAQPTGPNVPIPVAGQLASGAVQTRGAVVAQPREGGQLVQRGLNGPRASMLSSQPHDWYEHIQLGSKQSPSYIRTPVSTESRSPPNIAALTTQNVKRLRNHSQEESVAARIEAPTAKQMRARSGVVGKMQDAAERRGRGSKFTRKWQRVPQRYCYSETWIVQEYCDGGSLRDALKRGIFKLRNRDLAVLNMVLTAIDIAKGMSYLQKQAIIHGDLKAANILLSRTKDQRGVVAKVADFGLSRRLSGKYISTKTYGTVTHMPPELLLTGRTNSKCDVYSYGVVLWEMAEAKSAYTHLSHGQVIHEVIVNNLRPTWSHGIDEQYRILARECWQTEPRNRPSFDEIITRLNGMRKVYQGRIDAAEKGKDVLAEEGEGRSGSSISKSTKREGDSAG